SSEYNRFVRIQLIRLEGGLVRPGADARQRQPLNITFWERTMGRSISRVFLVTSLVFVIGATSAAFAQSNRERSTKKARAAANQSAKAARVFEQIMGTREKSIPEDLLDRAEAVAVFPGVLKGGFIIGGRGGSGVISRRVVGGWSAPAFFDLGGGSIGLQIGVASTDYILLFMNENAVESLLKDKFEIG